MEQTRTQELAEDMQNLLDGFKENYSWAQQKFMEKWDRSPTDAIHWRADHIVEAEYKYRLVERIEEYRDVLLERAVEEENIAKKLGDEPEVAALFWAAREAVRQITRDLTSNRFRASSTSGFSNEIDNSQRTAASELVDSFMTIKVLVERYDSVVKQYELGSPEMVKMLSQDLKQARVSKDNGQSMMDRAAGKKGAAQTRRLAQEQINQAIGKEEYTRALAKRLGILDQVEELAEKGKR